MSDKPAKQSASLEEHLETLRNVFGKAPFLKSLGVVIESIGIDEATLRLPWADHLARNLNILHGGVVASLIDTAGGVATFSDYKSVATLNAATINMLVNYLAAGAPGRDVLAKARVRKRGRSIVVVDVDVEDAEGKLIATGTTTYKLGTKSGQGK